MKKLVLLFLVLFVIVGCTTMRAESTKSVTANTVFAMHDLVKVGSVAANDMCKQGVIDFASCAKIKSYYDKFRLAYPLVTDTLVIYLQSDDKSTMQNFLAAQAALTADYQQLFNLLTEFGVLKKIETGGTK